MPNNKMRDIKRIIDHEDFEFHFSNDVDPVRLLPCLKLRNAHEDVIRKLNDRRRDEANMELLKWLKCEALWKEKLFKALDRNGYLESLWTKLYPNKRYRKSTEERVVTLDTPLTDVQPLHSSLQDLDIDWRWRDLAIYAGLTWGDVEMIEAKASAERKMRSEKLIHFLITQKGDDITLGWLLKGLRQLSLRNIFTKVCQQVAQKVNMADLLEDTIDGPDVDQAWADATPLHLIGVLWDHLQVPPASPPQSGLVEAVEEWGSQNKPGNNVPGRQPPPLAPLVPVPGTAESSPVFPAQPQSAGGSRTGAPGIDVRPEPTVGTSPAPLDGLFASKSDREMRQEATAASLSAPTSALPGSMQVEALPDQTYKAQPGVENGPCPNRDIVNAEERQDGSEENFYTVNSPLLFAPAPDQATTSAADHGSLGMDSSLGREDSLFDSIDDQKPYEVMLREDRFQQDSAGESAGALSRNSNSTVPVNSSQSTQSSGEEPVENVVSYQSDAGANSEYLNQNGISGEASLGQGNRHSSLSSSRSIDLSQHRGRRSQSPPSDEFEAGAPLEGIQVTPVVLPLDPNSPAVCVFLAPRGQEPGCGSGSPSPPVANLDAANPASSDEFQAGAPLEGIQVTPAMLPLDPNSPAACVFRAAPGQEPGSGSGSPSSPVANLDAANTGAPADSTLPASPPASTSVTAAVRLPNTSASPPPLPQEYGAGDVAGRNPSPPHPVSNTPSPLSSSSSCSNPALLSSERNSPPVIFRPPSLSRSGSQGVGERSEVPTSASSSSPSSALPDLFPPAHQTSAEPMVNGISVEGENSAETSPVLSSPVSVGDEFVSATSSPSGAHATAAHGAHALSETPVMAEREEGSRFGTVVQVVSAGFVSLSASLQSLFNSG